MLEVFKPIDGCYDNVVRDCFKKNKNSSISWFLSSSYCYYQKDESLMSDIAFDKLCKWMFDNHDSLEHEHKHLVTKDMLQAGSGFNLKADDYPLRVQHSAPVLIKMMYAGQGSASKDR